MLKVFFVNGVTKFLIEEFLCNMEYKYLRD